MTILQQDPKQEKPVPPISAQIGDCKIEITLQPYHVEMKIIPPDGRKTKTLVIRDMPKE